MLITTRRYVVCKNHVAGLKVKVTIHTHSLCIGISCSPAWWDLKIILAQMIIKPRQCVLCKNHVATSKVKLTVRTYSLCVCLNETYMCRAHNFVVGPASGLVRYKDLVFHPFVRSHQGAIFLKAIGGSISVLLKHCFSIFFKVFHFQLVSLRLTLFTYSF